MGFFSGAGKLLKPLVDIPRWIGFRNLTDNASVISEVTKELFTPQQAAREEEFQEAISRLNLTEADLEQRKREFYRLTIIFLLITVLVLAYACYQFFYNHAIFPGIVSLIIAGLPLVLAFRYHFWYFQIKRRKLGATLREWFYVGLLGKEP